MIYGKGKNSLRNMETIVTTPALSK